MIQFKGLPSAAADEITKMIISGEFPGGSRLNEEEIASTLSISRVPLREALQTLEQRYLVYSVPRRGKYVTRLSMDNLKKIVQCREMLECQAIDLLEASGNESTAKLKEKIEEAKNTPFPSDNESERFRYLIILNGFHDQLIENTNNELLSHFHFSIASNMKRYIYMYTFRDKRPEVYSEDHERIYNYLKEKDFRNAHKALRSHIRENFERMKRHFQHVFD